MILCFLEKLTHMRRCTSSTALVKSRDAVTSCPCHLRALENLLQCRLRSWLWSPLVCAEPTLDGPRGIHTVHALHHQGRCLQLCPVSVGAPHWRNSLRASQARQDLLHQSSSLSQCNSQKVWTASLPTEIIISSGWQEILHCLKVSIPFRKRYGLTLDLDVQSALFKFRTLIYLFLIK